MNDLVLNSRSIWLLKRRDVVTTGLALIIAAVYFVFSMFLLGLYVNGDQIAYSAFYGQLAGVSFKDIPGIQFGVIGGVEPIYGYVAWFGANVGVEKTVYISIFNALLAASLFVLLRRYRASVLFIILALSNYYLLVLMTSAERLKFAYIAMILAVLSTGNVRALLASLSVLSHFQTLINYAAVTAAKFRPKQILSPMSFWGRSKRIFAVLLSVVVSFYILQIYSGALMDKAQRYIGGGGIYSAFNLVLLSAIGLCLAKRRAEFLMAMAAILVAAIILGAERVNMIGFLTAIYLLMVQGRADHPAVYMLLAYFVVKSYYFILAIIRFGDGFRALS